MPIHRTVCLLLSLAPMPLRAALTDAECQSPTRISSSMGECFEQGLGGRWLLSSIGIADSWRSLAQRPQQPVFPENATHDAMVEADDDYQEKRMAHDQELQLAVEKVKAFVAGAVQSRAVRAKLCRYEAALLNLNE